MRRRQRQGARGYRRSRAELSGNSLGPSEGCCAFERNESNHREGGAAQTSPHCCVLCDGGGPLFLLKVGKTYIDLHVKARL